jgi:hypothetical protein
VQERERDKLTGDVSGASEGDFTFTDWDNPEDEYEDAPEGYYDEDEPDEEYELTPDDPDFDLSEAAGYAGWEAPRRELVPRWALVAFSALLIASLLVPVLLNLD